MELACESVPILVLLGTSSTIGAFEECRLPRFTSWRSTSKEINFLPAMFATIRLSNGRVHKEWVSIQRFAITRVLRVTRNGRAALRGSVSGLGRRLLVLFGRSELLNLTNGLFQFTKRLVMDGM